MDRTLRRAARKAFVTVWMGIGVAGCVAGAQLWAVTSAAAEHEGRSASVVALGKRLVGWVRSADSSDHEKAAQRVEQGVPPGALAAFLAATRENPQPRYTPLIDKAAGYRNVVVRGHALAAMAELGPQRAQDAIARAADDLAQPIRRLAWALERLHPSPAAHEVVAAMLERDPELAEAIQAELAAQLEDDEVVVFDDDLEADTQ